MGPGGGPSFRVAIFGLGDAAESIHLPACASLPGVEVTSACEPDATRRDRIGWRFRVPRLYPNAQSLLAEERPDVVIIGTPPDSHRDLCLLVPIQLDRARGTDSRQGMILLADSAGGGPGGAVDPPPAGGGCVA